MVYSSRLLALILAMCIAVIVTLLLTVFESIGTDTIFISFLVTFLVAYMLTFVVLEFVIFQEISQIHKQLEKLKKNDLQAIKKKDAGILNPLKGINKEIFAFADLKQKEIEQLKKLEAFRTEFIADVSHELKTPIFAAQGF